VSGRHAILPIEGVQYHGFVDMSGGSSDDATLGISHYDETRQRAVLNVCMTQAGKPPFNPRLAVTKFAEILKRYRVRFVTGDRYAGTTFENDFQEHGISYQQADCTKSQLYEALEPRINAGEVELLDVPRLTEQLLGLVVRGTKIDHLPGEHDDLANAAAGALHLAQQVIEIADDGFDVMAINQGRYRPQKALTMTPGRAIGRLPLPQTTDVRDYLYDDYNEI
jgi:hypothetical protein